MKLIDEIRRRVGYVDTIIWAPCMGNEGIEKNKKYEAVVLLKDVEKIFADRASNLFNVVAFVPPRQKRKFNIGE